MVCIASSCSPIQLTGTKYNTAKRWRLSHRPNGRRGSGCQRANLYQTMMLLRWGTTPLSRPLHLPQLWRESGIQLLLGEQSELIESCVLNRWWALWRLSQCFSIPAFYHDIDAAVLASQEPSYTMAWWPPIQSTINPMVRAMAWWPPIQSTINPMVRAMGLYRQQRGITTGRQKARPVASTTQSCPYQKR